MRCLVTRTDSKVEDPNRAVTVGDWSQIRDDVLKLRDAGVDEVFFDVAFQKDAQSPGGLREYMERFRNIVETPVAV